MSGWTDTTVGDEIDLSYGKGLSTQERDGGCFPVFGSNGRVGHHSAALVSGPGIIVGRKGSVGEVVFSQDDFWPIDTTYYVVNKGQHDWRFLFHLLSTLGLRKLNSHSAVPGLNREDVYCIDVSIPDVQEQRKIGQALDKMQFDISLEDEAIDIAQDLKRAAMRALFTKGLRGEVQKETEIGFMPESWDVVALGALGKLGSGTTPDRKQPAYWNGFIPWITSGRMYEREIDGSDVKVTSRAIAESSLPLLKPGAVLIAIVGQGKTLGHCAMLRCEATVSRHVGYVQPDTFVIEPTYLRAFLEWQYEALRQIASGNGSTRAALTAGNLRPFPIPLPPTLDEQREMVAILEAIDFKIDLHKRKRAVLDELFKALLHKLVTGEIRITDIDLSALEAAKPAEIAA